MSAQNVIRKAHRFTAKSRGRRALARVKSTAPLPEVNNRVREVNEAEWVKARKARFASAVEWAGAAKAYRTARHLTQEQVGIGYGGVKAATICNWESGHHFNWDREVFAEWCAIVNAIADSIERRGDE